MSTMTAQNKLDSMKKTGKILRIVTLITSIVASLLLILFLLMPVTNLQLGGAGKYIEGYNYYGWQLAIFGCGYPPVTSWRCLRMPVPWRGTMFRRRTISIPIYC